MPKMTDKPIRINIVVTAKAHARIKQQARERSRREGAFCSMGRVVSEVCEGMPPTSDESLSRKAMRSAERAAG